MFSHIRYRLPRGLAVLAPLLCATSFAADAIDLKHVPAQAAAVVIVRPQQLSQSPELQLLPWEVLQAAAKQEWGIDPLRIELGIGMAATPEPNSPPSWGLALYFSEPQQPAAKWLEQSKTVTFEQITYRRMPGPAGVSFYQPDARTLLVGHEPMLKDMIAAGDDSSPLRETLSSVRLTNDITAVIAFSQMRDMVKQSLAEAPPLPPPLQPLLKVPDQLETVMVALNLSRQRVSGIKLLATDEAAAQQLETTLRQTLAFGKQMLLGQLMQSMQGGREGMDDAMAKGLQQYMLRIGDLIESRLQPVRTGKELLITLNADYATSGVLVALLLPAVQAAREAARRAQGMNNLKLLIIAMHNFHDAHQRFPAAYSTAADGKPLLSWRVYLLPYLDQQALFEQFRLDQAWDSPHNQRLIAQMPELFRSPGTAAPQGRTTYLGIYGDDMLFIPPREHGGPPLGCGIGDIRDGTSNTAAIVETNDELAVEWTRPADYEPDRAQPHKGLVGRRPGGFLAAMADGSVRFISQSIEPASLLRLFTRADGQPVNLD